MPVLTDATWSDIEALRTRLSASLPIAATVEEGAQVFVEAFAAAFPAIVLARLFIVIPFGKLRAEERRWATSFAQALDRAPQLTETTEVLLLLGTTGALPAWCDRRRSAGHVAIPLLDRAFVQGAPMIAALFEALQVDLAVLDDHGPLALRRLQGSHNGRFYVADASTTRDAQGRSIIAAHDFVAKHHVRTVFGMGGAYVDGTLAFSIFFTQELLAGLVVDRFPSFISTFKMGTAKQLAAGLLMRA